MESERELNTASVHSGQPRRDMESLMWREKFNLVAKYIGLHGHKKRKGCPRLAFTIILISFLEGFCNSNYN